MKDFTEHHTIRCIELHQSHSPIDHVRQSINNHQIIHLPVHLWHIQLAVINAQIIKEQLRASKIKNNPEEFHWHDEYATLNFFRFICKNIGNLGNGEIEKMVTRLKSIDQKAVENHVNGAVWAFDYDKMFCVLMENEICRKVCEKNKYNSWMKLIGQYCISMA